MTDLTQPGEYGENSTIDPIQVANALEKAGPVGWVVNGADLSPIFGSVDETAMDAFGVTSASSSSFDVTFGGGEAYVGGWLCRDRETTVTLPSEDTTRVFVGYDVSQTLGSTEAPADNENVIIGPGSEFDSEDPTTPLYDVTTTTNGVLQYTDLRILNRPIRNSDGGVRVSTDLEVNGALTNSGFHMLRRTQDWDGTSVVYSTPDGDTLELRRE